MHGEEQVLSIILWIKTIKSYLRLYLMALYRSSTVKCIDILKILMYISILDYLEVNKKNVKNKISVLQQTN